MIHCGELFFDESEFSYTIVMKELAQLEDSGNYSLKIKSNGHRSPNSLNFDVLNNQLILNRLPEKLELFENELLNLEVGFTRPVKFHEWTKDSKALTNKSLKIKNGKLTESISIPSVKIEDGGVYDFKCSDDNDSEKHSTFCEVIVKERPEKILKPLKDISVKEGQQIELIVQLDRLIPDEKINWIFKGIPFESSKHGEDVTIKSIPETKSYQIIIKNSLKIRDDGVFGFKTPNTFSECKVEVEETPIVFKKELENFKLKV